MPKMGSLVQFPGYLDGTNGQEGDPNVVELMRPFWKAGYQVHCHANGDQALQITLDALAELQATHPRFDHRFTVEHFSMSTPMQIRRLKALGGIASVNGYFIHFRSLLHRTNAYGPDRSEVVARLGTLEREGITFALHSDYPQVVVPLDIPCLQPTRCSRGLPCGVRVQQNEHLRRGGRAISRRRAGTRLITCPSSRISPPLSRSRPAMARSTLDLPLSAAPSRTNSSPGRICRSVSRKTSVRAAVNAAARSSRLAGWVCFTAADPSLGTGRGILPPVRTSLSRNAPWLS